MLLLFISFSAGVLTVLAPCILPLLPVIIGGTVSGGTSTARALRVIGALALSVTVFTLALKVSTLFIAVPPFFWKALSGGLLIAFGVVTAFPTLWERLRFTARINSESSKIVSSGFMQGSAKGDILVGAALGPVFTSCSPTYFVLLATVLPADSLRGIVYLVAYVLGLSLALLCIALVGQKIVDRLGTTSDSHGWFKRSIGALFIIVGLAVLTGADVLLATSLPQSAYGITSVEQKLLEYTKTPEQIPQPEATTTLDGTNALCTGGTCTTTMEAKKIPEGSVPSMFQSAMKDMKYKRAPEFVSPDAYLNTGGKPIRLANYRGNKVVLLDIWTYSCINCQRTLPYIKDWYAKYKDQGLEVVGVHTPEFAFEHLEKNVQSALEREGIAYPVVLDNEYKTWNALGNQYWPRKYLIDIDGYIVYDHIGEGGYAETELAIQAALAERALRLGTSLKTPTQTTVVAPVAEGVESPEVYFGSDRNNYLGNGTQATQGVQKLVAPTTSTLNTLYLDGTWGIAPEYAQTTGPSSRIIFRYKSKDVYMVLSAEQGADVEVLQDGVRVSGEAGEDVSTGMMHVQNERLYKIIHNSAPGEHTLELRIKSGTLKAYTFTFG